MCARRFLAVIFVLTLLVVAGSFAIYKWGGNVLLRQATPQGHFKAAEAGAGPDYTKAENWIARPDIPENPADWLPAGVAQGSGGAAVFYVHPTTYLLRDRWNAPLQPGAETEFRTRLFVQSQASAFNAAGSIWAPRYRQAAYGAFLLKNEDSEQALDLAYGDVKSAFAAFLAQLAADQPLILAAHSQGALHLSRLLRDEAPRLKDRLVAAYVVGWPLSTRADLPAIGVQACAAPNQTDCILSWQSFGEPANPDLILDSWQGTTGPTGIKRNRKDMLCVNPLTGTTGGKSGPSDRAETLVPNSDLRSATVTDGVTARCAKGFLLLGGRVPAMGPYVLPGNNYHVYDYALFWGAIRSDAARRLAAWQAR
jgi:hypothetical protein